MLLFFIFFFGTFFGGIVMWLFVRHTDADVQKDSVDTGSLEARNLKARELKEERKRKILALLKERPKIANNDVERLLDVSDATATRYLQELEDEGRVEQVGKEGRSVFYRLKSNGLS